jgi:hypothetical protein
VAAGPGRMGALVLASAGAPLAWRWRRRLDRLVALVAAALALRVATESVLVPFYLWPPLAVGLAVAAGARSWRPLALAAAVALIGTGSAEVSLPWLVWWALAVATVAGTLAVAARSVARSGRLVACDPRPLAVAAGGSSSSVIVPLAPQERDRCSEGCAGRVGSALAGPPKAAPGARWPVPGSR